MKKLSFLLFSAGWIFLNVFFLPFFPWTSGIVMSWFFLNGYIPYRDVIWLRMPFDLFTLGGWFKLFGVGEISYQYFIFTLLLLIAITIYIFSIKFFSSKKFFPFLFFIIFLFPLFLNTEMGEILIALLSSFLLLITFIYLDRRKIWLLFVAGFICGLASITKQNSGGIIIASILTVALDSYIKKDFFLNLLKRESCLVVGFLFPLLGLMGYYFFQKAIGDLFFYTIFMVLGIYRLDPIPQGQSFGDAMWIEYGYFALLLPFLIFRKQTGLTLQKIIFITVLILFLFPSLLPSYLSYRAFTAYPIISVVAGYDLFIFIQYLKRRDILKSAICLIFFTAFIFFTLRFTQAYLMSIRDDGFHAGNIIRDYGSSQLEAAEWIKKNTKEDEKIASLGNMIIFFASNRFPKNKYIDDATSMLYPFDKSSAAFMTDLPRILVFNEGILENQPKYVYWPFYDYFKKNYIVREKFGELTIYELPKN